MRHRMIFGNGARLDLMLGLAMAVGPAGGQNQTPATWRLPRGCTSRGKIREQD